MGAHGVGERGAAHRHAERLENLSRRQDAIGHVRRLRQRISQNPEAEIGVFVGRAGIARQLVFGKKGFQFRGVVVGIGILRISPQQVRRQPWQAGILRGEFAERDLVCPARRNLEVRQQPRDRRVERYATREHRLGEERGSEGLGDRADLIDGVSVGRLAGVERAENHDLALVAVDDAERQRAIDSRRDPLLRGFFHALRQWPRIGRHARHEENPDNRRRDAPTWQ